MAPRPIERVRVALIVAACLCAVVVTAALTRGGVATASHARNAAGRRLGGFVDASSPRPASAIETLVSTYRRGDPAVAMAEFLKWDAKRVAREATLPADAPPADLAALALMHTMAAVARGTFGGGNQSPVPDRTYFPAALSLVGTLSRRADMATDPCLRAFCRDWYIVVVSLWCAGRNYGYASVVVRAGQRPFGDDPRFLLAAGSTAEALMGPFASGGGLVTSRGIVGDDRLDAEKWLRRAVSLDPGLVEARLRLGRVLYQIDYIPQARKELEQTLADATATKHAFAAYLAALFLGELLERRGELDAARAAFEKAVSVNPECQAAYLALGHLLVVAGKPGEGWANARRVFGDAEKPRKPAIDPWFLYRSAQFWQAETLLRGMAGWVRQ
jgi:tetratricopeptide (TPR) repeat protein